MNRQGFLLAEETLKIVIALISISFLVYFLTSLYMSNQNSKDLELAKASLEHLISEINSLEAGKSKEVEIYNPNGWVIASWPRKVLKGTIGFRQEVDDWPKSCSNMNWDKCICICEDTLVLNLEGDDCDDNGICLESDFTIDKITKIENPPIKLTIDKDSKTIK